jgi:hypothetical protein
MFAYELVKLAVENPQKYRGKEYKVVDDYVMDSSGNMCNEIKVHIDTYKGLVNIRNKRTDDRLYFSIITKLEEIKQSVTFLEALNRGTDGFVNIYPKGEKPNTLEYWVSSFPRITAKGLQKILNGDWYIE